MSFQIGQLVHIPDINLDNVFRIVDIRPDGWYGMERYGSISTGVGPQGSYIKSDLIAYMFKSDGTPIQVNIPQSPHDAYRPADKLQAYDPPVKYDPDIFRGWLNSL